LLFEITPKKFNVYRFCVSVISEVVVVMMMMMMMMIIIIIIIIIIVQLRTIQKG